MSLEILNGLQQINVCHRRLCTTQAEKGLTFNRLGVWGQQLTAKMQLLVHQPAK